MFACSHFRRRFAVFSSFSLTSMTSPPAVLCPVHESIDPRRHEQPCTHPNVEVSPFIGCRRTSQTPQTPPVPDQPRVPRTSVLRRFPLLYLFTGRGESSGIDCKSRARRTHQRSHVLPEVSVSVGSPRRAVGQRRDVARFGLPVSLEKEGKLDRTWIPWRASFYLFVCSGLVAAVRLVKAGVYLHPELHIILGGF